MSATDRLQTRQQMLEAEMASGTARAAGRPPLGAAWTREVRARCRERCAEACDPPCFELDDLEGVEPCAPCLTGEAEQ